MSKISEKTVGETSRSILPPLSATTVSSILLIADTLSILGSGYATYDSIIAYSPSQNIYATAVVFVWLVTVAILNFGNLYRYEAATHPASHIHTVIIAIATSFLFLLAASLSIRTSISLPSNWLIWFGASCAVSVITVRLAVSFALVHLLHVSGAKRNLAFVGGGEQCRRLQALLAEDPNRPIKVSGIFSDRAFSPPVSDHEAMSPTVFDGDLGKLVEKARTGLIDDVVVSVPWSEDHRIMEIVAKLRELPVNVFLVSDLIGFRTEFRNPPSHFGSLPILQIVGKPMSGWDAVIKALEDYVLAAIALILVSPVLLIIAALIKIDSRGPVFFKQERLGFNNQIFDVYKFRTMYHANYIAEKTQQATLGDQRVTKFGRFLRRWSLDELPQIFNVLNGSMSLVGPRPHALDHNEEFSKRTKGYFARHRVKPGITGLAQIKGFRGATDTEEKLEGRVRNDIFYAENWSLSLDVYIMLRTFVICLIGKNAY
jgi:putative colanic acid biosysnthesis UDP-glucose lipid carrier transferase